MQKPGVWPGDQSSHCQKVTFENKLGWVEEKMCGFDITKKSILSGASVSVDLKNLLTKGSCCTLYMKSHKSQGAIFYMLLSV